MSTDYTLYCKDCDDELDVSNIREPAVLRDAWARRESIAALDGFTGSVEPSDGQRVLLHVSFFVRHREHRVVIRDEYGVELGHCAGVAKCPTCGSRARCVRSIGHDGKCEAST